jgi:hypothetical protein
MFYEITVLVFGELSAPRRNHCVCMCVCVCVYVYMYVRTCVCMQ